MNRPAATFFLFYLGAILYLSLYPFHFLPYARSLMLFWVDDTSRRVYWDTILNVLFYMPLGAAALVALGRSIPAWIASVLLGSMLSFAVETMQLFIPTRVGNLRDLAANAAGTIVGASAAYILLDQRIARRISPFLQSTPWKVSAAGTLFLVLWMLWQAFPFVPSISFSGPTRAWAEVRHMDWSWATAGVTAGRSLFGFYALALVVGAKSRWLPVAFLVLPAQMFLLNHKLSVPAMAGALAGWATARVIKAPRFAGAALVAWLAVEEFRPFHFEAVSRAFTWAPFQSWFESAPEANYPVYFSKTFLYTSVVWALRRCGLGWTTAVLVPAALLAIGEWAQRSLEGRTPENTDLVLLAAGALLLKLCE
jgi:VanZ family protein